MTCIVVARKLRRVIAVLDCVVNSASIQPIRETYSSNV